MIHFLRSPTTDRFLTSPTWKSPLCCSILVFGVVTTLIYLPQIVAISQDFQTYTICADSLYVFGSGVKND